MVQPPRWRAEDDSIWIGNAWPGLARPGSYCALVGIKEEASTSVARTF